MRLQCGNAIVNGGEKLWWEIKKKSKYSRLQVASRIYPNGTVADVSYHDRLVDGRAELSPGGSLTIHSYEHMDAGNYSCYNEYRSVWSGLTTFSEYLF